MPPHWAELVNSLASIPIYTEKQVGTWQLNPDIEMDDGDFSDANLSIPPQIKLVRELWSSAMLHWYIKLHKVTQTVLISNLLRKLLQIPGKC